MAQPPDPIELDVLAVFMARMPFLALPGPPRFLALTGPVGVTQHVAPTSVQRVAEAAPEPVRPEPVRSDPEAKPRPRPTPAPSAQPKVELGPSPFDPGFSPPTTGLRERPETNPGPDPRTLSLNRAKRATAPLMPAAPLPTPSPSPRAAQPSATHDILIVPQSPVFKTSDQGLQAVINYLRTSQMLSPRVMHTDEHGVVYEFVPDVFVHQMFVEGVAPAGPPCVLEATLRALRVPTAVRFGPPARMSCFSLELVGCRFGFVIDAFKQRLQQILYLRPEVHAAPHDPLRLRAPSAEHRPAIPAFDLQEVDRG